MTLMNARIDPATLTEADVKDAISTHCSIMGSRPYYYADEIERWKANPDCLVIFADTDSHGKRRLRAYTTTSR